MRRIAATLLAVALLASCALIPPTPKTITVPTEKLERLIARQFPFDSTMLDVLDVVVSAPRIALDPANNRINTAFDLSVGAGGILGKSIGKSYQGSLDLSYGLRFDPRDGTLRLHDVHVTRLSVDGAPDAWRRPIERLGPLLAQKLLKDHVLYRVDQKDLQAHEGWRYQPGVFSVSPEGLSVTLEPVAY